MVRDGIPEGSFFDYLNFQKIEVHRFDKAVSGKTCLTVNLKLTYRGIQPDRFFQVKFVADFIQGLEDHLGSGEGVVSNGNDRVL